MNLTHERLLELVSYDANTGLFTSKVSRPPCKVGKILGSKHAAGYVELRLDYKSYLAHRLAWFYTHGTWPVSEIDHINQDRTDNRLSNLRDVNRSENNRNSRTRSAYGRWITFRKDTKTYLVQLRTSTGKLAKTFKTIEEADAFINNSPIFQDYKADVDREFRFR